MAQTILVCEGPKGGLDGRMLDLMMADIYGLSLYINPACGDATVKSVVAHYRSNSENRQDVDRAHVYTHVLDRQKREVASQLGSFVNGIVEGSCNTK